VAVNTIKQTNKTYFKDDQRGMTLGNIIKNILDYYYEKLSYMAGTFLA
jgi:hypothetical protein